MKTSRLAFLFLLLVVTATAQDVPAAPSVADPFADLVAGLAGKYPWLATVLAVVAACRLLLKPLFTFLHEVVKVTPSQKDDVLLAKVEASRVFRWVVFALDYLLSIRLIHPQTQSAPAQPLSPVLSATVKPEEPR